MTAETGGGKCVERHWVESYGWYWLVEFFSGSFAALRMTAGTGEGREQTKENDFLPLQHCESSLESGFDWELTSQPRLFKVFEKTFS
jgi:hypothetical protein